MAKPWTVMEQFYCLGGDSVSFFTESQVGQVFACTRMNSIAVQRDSIIHPLGTFDRVYLNECFHYHSPLFKVFSSLWIWAARIRASFSIINQLFFW